MPDQITTGWNAIAMVLDVPVEDVKNVVKAAGISVWEYKSRVHAYTKDLVKHRELMGDNVWHVRLKDGIVEVYRGAVKGQWCSEGNAMVFYRMGMELYSEPINVRPFKDFLIKVQEIPL